ncbi:metal-dependent hydrolase [Parasphingorhabdus cellanae]|uniref:Metal-dependent hydrolase n=1 Tax=Parasphingorhabdus cellanae TaxID=2806553 RepID=A0ABX7T4B9_9SPHN|nr:metal-dependent hydrolase [Parasphingorhabdus cellanae]QTD55976.1 metal-dependent hydrolase [Parasphingorhabdus cellanae]
MDNLTHSLAGAVLGQLGLKKKTGLGMATLIIAANIPDIDAIATLLDGVQHLAIRRGITHGPIAMVILPLLLTGTMILFDGWQTKRGKRPADRLPIHRGWLLALAYIGCLSHPALDWLNSYGIRLLEPFSSQWFYGDSIFIIDIWIWAALITGVWISRRREKKGRDDWQRPAWVSFAAICAYIFANGLITGKAEDEATKTVQYIYQLEPTLVVANPVPITFWKREILWRFELIDKSGTGALVGSGNYSLLEGASLDEGRNHSTALSLNRKIDDGGPILNGHRARTSGAANIHLDYLKSSNQDVDAFLFWSRMPLIGWRFEDDRSKNGYEFVIKDQRFDSPLVADRFSVEAYIDEQTVRRLRAEIVKSHE